MSRDDVFVPRKLILIQQARRNRRGVKTCPRCGTGDHHQKFIWLRSPMPDPVPPRPASQPAFQQASSTLRLTSKKGRHRILRDAHPSSSHLFAQTQSLDQRLISLRIFPFEIRQVAPALAHQFEQASPRPFVVFVLVQVINQGIDAVYIIF